MLVVSERVTLFKNQGSGTVNLFYSSGEPVSPSLCRTGQRAEGSAVNGAPSYRRRPPKCGDDLRSHNGT